MHKPSESYDLPFDRAEPEGAPLVQNGSPADEQSGDGSQHDDSGRPFVLTVITLTVVVTIVAISLIFYRWSTVSEPVSAIVVEGDASIAPTAITVASTEFPLIAPPDLTSENHYIMPVLLHPGRYLLTAKQEDRIVLQAPFKIEPHRGIHIRLPSPQVRQEQAEAEKAAPRR